MLDGLLSFFKGVAEWEKSALIKFLHMCARGTIIYFTSIVLIRFNRRFAGVRTPFNFILFVMLGSIAASAITVEAPFLPVYALIVFMASLNSIVAGVVYLFPSFEKFLKGPVILLAKNGEIQWANMRKNYITKRDLYTELRDQLQTDDLSSVDFALLEADGEIHFVIRAKGETKAED